jgi:putative transcriptional regulator
MTSLTGQLLIAMPQMEDPFFARSVVYLCEHSSENGAMGLIINRILDELTTDQLYAQLGIEPVLHAAEAVHFGGPVATGNGFVLHSPDYREEATLPIAPDFALTATVEILRAKARGQGPRQCLLTLGYAGWGPGQLDAEIGANGWLSVAADADLVFETKDDSKWSRALAKLGVSPEMLSGDTGRA